MKFIKVFTVLFAITMLFHSANAQLNISGEYRVRGMADHGFMIPALENTNTDFSIDQRTRLNIKYTSKKYETYFSLQDARLWGDDDLISKTGVWGNSSSLGLHEAWINLKLGDNSNLKIGRQEWNYDNMRLLSYRNWATAAMSYDGILYQAKNKDLGLSLDLGLSYNNNGNPMGSVDNSDWQVDKLKTMNFLHLQKAFSEKTSLSLLFTLSGKTDTSNQALLGTGTHGLIFTHNKGKASTNGLFGNIEGYYQHGTDLKRGSDGKYKSISAYMLVFDLGFRAMEKKLEIAIGGELLSGHDYSNTDVDYNNTRHSFDLLYGGRLPFYGGYMNQFIIQDSYLLGTKGGGYFDPYIKLKYAPNKKNIIEAAIFNPILTTKVKAHTGVNTAIKKPTGIELDENGNNVYWQGGLGQYFDLSMTHKFSKELIIKAGMSYALVSDIKNQMVYGYEDAANKELHSMGQNYFGWVMLVVRPNFYTSK